MRSQRLVVPGMQLVTNSGKHNFMVLVRALGHVFVAGGEQNQYLEALAFGKTKELVHVDMAAKMEESGLASLFPVVSWPEMRAVWAVVSSWVVRVLCIGCRLLGGRGCDEAGELEKEGRASP